MRCPAPQRPASWLHSPSCTVDGSGLEDPLGGVCGRPSVSALWPVESWRPLSYSLGHRNIRRPRGTVASQGTNIGRASDKSATQSPMKDQLPEYRPTRRLTSSYRHRAMRQARRQASDTPGWSQVTGTSSGRTTRPRPAAPTRRFRKSEKSPARSRRSKGWMQDPSGTSGLLQCE